MTIEQEKKQRIGPAAFLMILIGLLAGLPATLHAGCKGAAEIPPERVTPLRNLLSAATAPGDFHVYAETQNTDGQFRFVLYSVNKASDRNTHIVYLAATSSAPQPTVVFAHDVSGYLPLFVRPAAPTPDVAPATVIIDGCLNTFALKPDLQAVHMNLFARSPGSQREAANDIVFVLQEQGSLTPVIEMHESSLYDHKRIHSDSVIAILPSTATVSDVIWWKSSQEGAGMATASYDQNTWYRWNGKGFDTMGTLQPMDLATRLQAATLLTRSDAISTVEMKNTIPGPNEPAP